MSIKRNFIYNFLLTGSNLLFPLLTFPYLSRVIGAEGLGICNFILSYCQNFIIIAALGLPVYGVREISKVGNDPVKRSKLFFELLTIHLAFTGFLLLIYVGSIFLFSDLGSYKDLALLGGLFVLMNVFTIEWFFTGVNDFKYITFRSLIVRGLSVIATFLLIKEKSDFPIYFIITISTVIITTFINVNYARKYITRGITISIRSIYNHLKSLAILGVYLILLNIYSIIPITLLGFFSSKAAVGYFYSANKIIRMIISVFASLTTVMIPKLNMLAEMNEKEHYLSLIQKSLNIAICFGIPISFGTFLLAEPLVMVLAGKTFANSIFCIQIMAPIILIVAFAQVSVNLILSVNRMDREMVIISVLGMIVSVLINILFIPHFAEKATAVSQFTAELTVTIFSFIFASKALSFQFPYKKLFLNIIFVIPFLLFVKIGISLSDNNILRLFYSFAFCFTFFMIYQLFFLKEKIILEISNSFLLYCRIPVKFNS
jgi:O-antigen/teichoic acid export membrane protein